MDDKYKDLYDGSDPDQNKVFNQLERLKFTPKQAARCVSRAYEKTKEGLDAEGARFLHIFADLYEINLKAACLSAKTISANEVIRLAIETGHSNDMGNFPNNSCRMAIRKFFKRLGKRLVDQAHKNRDDKNGF